MRDRDLLLELFRAYADADGVDALVLCWWAGEGDEAWSRTLLEPFAEVAEQARIPLVVSPVEATAVGAWTHALREQGVSFCRGLRSTYRALLAVDRVARSSPPVRRLTTFEAAAPTPPLLDTPAGPIVPFDLAMQMLADAGIGVAPFVVLAPDVVDDPAIASLGDRLVVKLADVPHRTELGAVRVGISPEELPSVVHELRAIAHEHGAPATVAVQSMVAGIGEAFVGIQGSTDLGPVLLFGAGGVLVEVAGGIDGAMLPLAPGAAARLVELVAGEPAFARLRGQARLARRAPGHGDRSVGALWQQAGSWLESADLNPLVVTVDGVVAVDALLVARAALRPEDETRRDVEQGTVRTATVEVRAFAGRRLTTSCPTYAGWASGARRPTGPSGSTVRPDRASVLGSADRTAEGSCGGRPHRGSSSPTPAASSPSSPSSAGSR